MLNFKNKEGKIVLSENSETGEIKVFDEKLKSLYEAVADGDVFSVVAPEQEIEEKVVE